MISRALDVIWAFPGAAAGDRAGDRSAVGGFKVGPISIARRLALDPDPDHRLRLRALHGAADPGRGACLREKEFVEAAVAQGAGPLRIMFSELLPNLASTIIVFFSLTIANNMLLEAALSFLGAGVGLPQLVLGEPDRRRLPAIYTAPHLTIVPGLMIILTVLALNVFGDGLRDALDPRAKIRLEQRSGVAEPEGRTAEAGNLMGRFIARRLVGMVAVLFAVSVIVFLIFNVIPI